MMAKKKGLTQALAEGIVLRSGIDAAYWSVSMGRGLRPV